MCHEEHGRWKLESIWACTLAECRQKVNLETALDAMKEDGNLFKIQLEKEKGRGEESFSTDKVNKRHKAAINQAYLLKMIIKGTKGRFVTLLFAGWLQPCYLVIVPIWPQMIVRLKNVILCNKKSC